MPQAAIKHHWLTDANWGGAQLDADVIISPALTAMIENGTSLVADVVTELALRAEVQHATVLSADVEAKTTLRAQVEPGRDVS